jgi:hypothetical protein
VKKAKQQPKNLRPKGWFQQHKEANIDWSLCNDRQMKLITPVFFVVVFLIYKVKVENQSNFIRKLYELREAISVTGK